MAERVVTNRLVKSKDLDEAQCHSALQQETMAPAIADYALIGDCRTAVRRFLDRRSRPLRTIAFRYRDQSQGAFHATGALSQYSLRSV